MFELAHGVRRFYDITLADQIVDGRVWLVGINPGLDIGSRRFQLRYHFSGVDVFVVVRRDGCAIEDRIVERRLVVAGNRLEIYATNGGVCLEAEPNLLKPGCVS